MSEAPRVPLSLHTVLRRQQFSMVLGEPPSLGSEPHLQHHHLGASGRFSQYQFVPENGTRIHKGPYS